MNNCLNHKNEVLQNTFWDNRQATRYYKHTLFHKISAGSKAGLQLTQYEFKLRPKRS